MASARDPELLLNLRAPPDEADANEVDALVEHIRTISRSQPSKPRWLLEQARDRWRSVATLLAVACLATTIVGAHCWAGASGTSPDSVTSGLQSKAVTWVPKSDPATGETYYYSPQLGKTAWKLPAAAAPRLLPGGGNAPTTTTTPMPTWPTTIVQCPGSFWVPGQGKIALVGAKWNVAGHAAGWQELKNGQITVHMASRSYWASSCGVNTHFDRHHYAGVKLLGKTFKWTVSMAGLGCGCNVALYLTSMPQNAKPSSCQDYYCDAGSVCGVSCTEVDLMEANKYAWLSTLHTDDDKAGKHVGYGQLVNDWNSTVYGPGAACIDTNKPINVAVSFPTDPKGTLIAMTVTLSQWGSACPLTASLSDYGGMAKVQEALEQGMTPILSYWESKDMLWMDGRGASGRGPCKKDTPSKCAKTVQIKGFSIEPM